MLIDNGKNVVEESGFAWEFNNHYKNIVEKSSEQNRCKLFSDINWLEDDVIIREIVQHCSNHPGILKQKKNFNNSQTVEQFLFYKFLKNINSKKAVGT